MEGESITLGGNMGISIAGASCSDLPDDAAV